MNTIIASKHLFYLHTRTKRTLSGKSYSYLLFDNRIHSISTKTTALFTVSDTIAKRSAARQTSTAWSIVTFAIEFADTLAAAIAGSRFGRRFGRRRRSRLGRRRRSIIVSTTSVSNLLAVCITKSTATSVLGVLLNSRTLRFCKSFIGYSKTVEILTLCSKAIDSSVDKAFG